MIHRMKLKAHPFEMISKGLKIYELRLYDGKRKLINVGDTIVFTSVDNPAQQAVTTVVALHRFKNFEQLYDALPLEKCGYTAETILDAHPSDMQEYYTCEMQQKYGVLAIEIALASN